jgi:hypothetical protein
MLAGSHPHVARRSAPFALLDGAERIHYPHLGAASAWWDYIEASTRIITVEPGTMPRTAFEPIICTRLPRRWTGTR